MNGTRSSIWFLIMFFILMSSISSLEAQPNPRYLTIKRNLEIQKNERTKALQAYEHFLKQGQKPTAIYEAIRQCNREIRQLEYELSQTPMYLRPQQVSTGNSSQTGIVEERDMFPESDNKQVNVSQASEMSINSTFVPVDSEVIGTWRLKNRWGTNDEILTIKRAGAFFGVYYECDPPSKDGEYAITKIKNENGLLAWNLHFQQNDRKKGYDLYHCVAESVINGKLMVRQTYIERVRTPDEEGCVIITFAANEEEKVLRFIREDK